MIIFGYNLITMDTNDVNAFLLNELERNILQSCSGKARGVKELGELLSVGYSSGEMKRSISRLLQLELIEYTVPAFQRSYSQRYRTTLKGKKYI